MSYTLKQYSLLEVIEILEYVIWKKNLMRHYFIALILENVQNLTKSRGWAGICQPTLPPHFFDHRVEIKESLYIYKHFLLTFLEL